jgi:hypothetical protein
MNPISFVCVPLKLQFRRHLLSNRMAMLPVTCYSQERVAGEVPKHWVVTTLKSPLPVMGGCHPNVGWMLPFNGVLLFPAGRGTPKDRVWDTLGTHQDGRSGIMQFSHE